MNCYQQKAQTTKARKRANGAYATAAQKAASRKLISEGMAALSVEELMALSTHPAYTLSQRENFTRAALHQAFG